MKNSNIPVGILFDKEPLKTDKVVILMHEPSDSALIKMAQKLINNAASQVTMIDFGGIMNHSELKESIRMIEQVAPNHINLISAHEIYKENLDDQDLLIIGLGSWKKHINSEYYWLSEAPSVLIISGNL